MISAVNPEICADEPIILQQPGPRPMNLISTVIFGYEPGGPADILPRPGRDVPVNVGPKGAGEERANSKVQGAGVAADDFPSGKGRQSKSCCDAHERGSRRRLHGPRESLIL
jgi:hypothetical protein